MVTFEEAYDIARNELRKINGCNEYEDVYVFYYDDENDGGIGCESVVYKEDGHTSGYTTYVMSRLLKGKKESEPKKIEL